MTEQELDNLKFPVGRFDFDRSRKLDGYIQTIREFPVKLNAAVKGLSDEQLDTPYRPGGWTIRQVVHHCADSHQNAFIRFKLALTEPSPLIKPYRQELWAEQPDYRLPLKPSLLILEGLHARWAVLLEQLTDSDLQLNYVHPEYGKKYSLHEAMATYAWHCDHHLAHITELKKRRDW